METTTAVETATSEASRVEPTATVETATAETSSVEATTASAVAASSPAVATCPSGVSQGDRCDAY
jgi:hypothetical protein